MSLFIEAEVIAGTDIKEAAYELMGLANKLGHTVKSKFQDVTLLACTDGTPEQLIDNWYRVRELDMPYKIARS